MNIRAAICELIATFALTYVGMLAIMHFAGDPGGLLGVAFAHGLVIAVMVAGIGHISGGHINPAVTIGLFLAKKIDAMNAIVYIIAQVVGAILAAFVINMAFGLTTVLAGTPALAAQVTMQDAIGFEFIATFFLMFVIYGAAVSQKSYPNAGMFIGMAVVVGILAIGPLTGAALNPARYLGGAIIGGDLQHVVVYLVGPILGAAVAALLWEYVLDRSPRPQIKPDVKPDLESDAPTEPLT